VLCVVVFFLILFYFFLFVCSFFFNRQIEWLCFCAVVDKLFFVLCIVYLCVSMFCVFVSDKSG